MKKHLSESGFTLIELTIVIAIIGILAAIAVPNFRKVKNDAIDKTTASTAKSIADTCMSCFDAGEECNLYDSSYGDPSYAWVDIGCDSSTIKLPHDSELEFNLVGDSKDTFRFAITHPLGAFIYCYGYDASYMDLVDYSYLYPARMRSIDMLNQGPCYENFFIRQVQKVLRPW